MKISNTIVKVEGSYSGNVGSYIGRAREIITFINSYSIGEILVASSATSSSNTKYADINKQLNVQYNTEEQFTMARNKENSKIDLSGFNHYWDLTLGVPCFKSVKNS